LYLAKHRIREKDKDKDKDKDKVEVREELVTHPIFI
jgi:hypothetical protein